MPYPVKLGRRSQDSVEVLEGLKEGDRIVTSANFLLDAESKLASTSSMQAMMGRIGMGDWQMRGAHEGKMEGMEGMEGMDMANMKGMEGMPGMIDPQVTARHTKDGLYEGTALFGMGGTWVVTVNMTVPGRPPIAEKFQFSVAGGGT